MTARPRLLFYVQHLLGIGHLLRASRIAKALAAGPFEVTVARGGDLPGALDFGDATVVALPPVKAGPGGFADLVAPDGSPFGNAARAARRDDLLHLFARVAPDVLLVEAFPFGRRQMRFELLPLLEAARSRAPRPLVACSVRDILQAGRKPGRDAETVDLVRRFFDRVLVHGDPDLAPFADTFPLTAALDGKLVHTGLVGPDEQDVRPTERFDAVVSVGGGAVGSALLRAAAEARPLCRLSGSPWLIVTGPNLPPGNLPPCADGVTLRSFEPSLPALLRDARVSISQAGYNTVADVLAAPGCRAVLVPFADLGETEQDHRASALEARGLAIRVASDDLTPATLAAAVDRSLDLPQRMTTFPLDGAARTGSILEQALAARR